MNRVLRRLLIPVVLFAVMASSLLMAPAGSAATDPIWWTGTRQVTYVNDGTRLVVLRISVQNTVIDGRHHYRGYIRIRTKKLQRGSMKPYPHSISGGTVQLLLTCPSGMLYRGKKYWDLGTSGSDGLSSRYGHWIPADPDCGVKAVFSARLGTGGRYYSPYLFSDAA